MICINSGILLEGYLDNELSADETRQLENHLKTCSECRKELESLKLLKDILKNEKPVDPGNDYWEESKSLILAKTTETDNWNISHQTGKISIKTDVRRAIFAVAASLVMLATSLFLGVESDKNLGINSNSDNIYVLIPVRNMVDNEQNIIVSEDEQINIAKGMLLISPPSALGRLNSIYNIYYGDY